MGLILTDLFNALVPTRTADITGTGDALLAQGQFNATANDLAILSDAGGHVLRVSCYLANLFGKVDPESLLEIVLDAGAVAINTVAVTTSTRLGHSLTLTTSTTGIILVKPDANGKVVVDITLNAAKANMPVSLKHRHYSRAATITVA